MVYHIKQYDNDEQIWIYAYSHNWIYLLSSNIKIKRIPEFEEKWLYFLDYSHHYNFDYVGRSEYELKCYNYVLELEKCIIYDIIFNHIPRITYIEMTHSESYDHIPNYNIYDELNDTIYDKYRNMTGITIETNKIEFVENETINMSNMTKPAY
jgi:hypothetical protein